MRVFLTIVFLCTLVVQASAIYRLKPGDRLSVSVWQDPKLDREVVIAPDGRISLPLAGHLRAGGQSTQQLEAAIRSRLQTNYKEKLEVTVMLLRGPGDETGREVNIYVTGEVANSGLFTVNRPTTVLQAISLAGGLQIFAAKRRIKIKRRENGEDVLIRFNYRAATKGRNPWSSIYLRDGDVVIVPERGLLKGLF